MTDLSELSSSAYWRVLQQDADPGETRRMARRVRRARREGRPRARDVHAAQAPGPRTRAARAAAAGAEHAVLQHDPARRAAAVSRRPRASRSASAAIMRWNALAMVVRANHALRRARRPHRELRVGGGPVRGRLQPFLPRGGAAGGDLVFFQPHSAPGVYARAFLEGRLTRRAPRALPAGDRPARGSCVVSASVADAGLLAVPDRLDGHRPDQRDLPGALHALPRAPRPRSIPRRPQGVGRRSATARWTSPSRSRGLSLAAREKLDNLVFVVNCNLQRLDGPVRGNGRSSRSWKACSPAPAGT